jgi:hypothetical protein
MFKFLKNLLVAIGETQINSVPVSNINNSTAFNNIELQTQDITGNWRTMHVTQNNSQMIISGMRQIASQFPDQRVRAVDSDGRIVDIL